MIIRLARLNYLTHLFKLFDRIYTTNFVKDEVLREDKQEYKRIKEFLNNVEIIDAASLFELRRIIKLDVGELSCLYFAKCRDIVFLTDDFDAMMFAKNFLEIESYGTLRIVIELYRKNIIPSEEAEKTIKNIREKAGLWVSDEIIEKALKMLLKR